MTNAEGLGMNDPRVKLQIGDEFEAQGWIWEVVSIEVDEGDSNVGLPGAGLLVEFNVVGWAEHLPAAESLESLEAL